MFTLPSILRPRTKLMSILFRNGLFAAAIAWFLSPANATVVLGPQLASTPAIPSGELLLGELNCAACHKVTNDSQTRLSPKLGKDGLRLTPQYLRKYLENPLKEKPGTTMPDMLHALDSSEKK